MTLPDDDDEIRWRRARLGELAANELVLIRTTLEHIEDRRRVFGPLSGEDEMAYRRLMDREEQLLRLT